MLIARQNDGKREGEVLGMKKGPRKKKKEGGLREEGLKEENVAARSLDHGTSPLGGETKRI